MPGGARHSGVEKTCRRHLSGARVDSQQSPVLLRDAGGYFRGRWLSRGFWAALKIFSIVGGQLVFRSLVPDHKPVSSGEILKPEDTGLQTTDPDKNGFVGRLRTNDTT